MLNIYEGILKITNPKLYHSPYKVNIDQVWKVLKNYKFSSRLLFLQNLPTLEIELKNQKEINGKFKNHPTAVYRQQENKIIITKDETLKNYEVCNHELFHVSSTNRKKEKKDDFGRCLNEGITEYLNLKSQNKKTSLSGYQVELFVIDFLIGTHGEQILDPYFKGNMKNFFKQFNENAQIIKEIEDLLMLSRKKDMYHNQRLKYLYLTDLIPKLINNDTDFLNNLNLNYKTNKLIYSAFSKNTPERQRRITNYFNELDMETVIKHIYEDETKKQILNNYIIDYKNQKKEIFDIILYKLMLTTKNVLPTKINRVIERSTKNKHPQFKNLYGDIINEYLIESKKTRWMIMKKILVQPNSLENLSDILKTDIDGIILPLEHLSVNSSIYFSLEDIRSILNLTSKEICISINKIMHNEDLYALEQVLISLNKTNISKIFFYDLSVMNIVKRLNIKKELVIFQDHLNASIYSNNFYKKRGINYAVITNDITKEEINEISKHNSLMLICYGYLPIFYSRRYLITNYLKYINKDKESNNYYIKNNKDKYPIVEEEFGTTIYTKEPINLINDINNLNIDYIILNANLTNREDFLSILNEYLSNTPTTKEPYRGFIDKKTVYKVADYD